MGTVIQALPAGGYILHEHPIKTIAREAKVLAAGQRLYTASVLGSVSLGAVTSAVKSGGANTGNGTCTPDVTAALQANAQIGIYTARCIAAAANQATFRISDPRGFVLGDANFSGAGASFTWLNQIKFAITDGGNDFAIGDGFDITVAAGSGKVKQLNPVAFDGTQYAVGFLFASTDATSADQNCIITARLTEVMAAEIIWPAGITVPQQAAATAQLAAANLFLR